MHFLALYCVQRPILFLECAFILSNVPQKNYCVMGTVLTTFHMFISLIFRTALGLTCDHPLYIQLRALYVRLLVDGGKW